MKLYGTITSERATKGQGGEYLDIELMDENHHVFATIAVREKETGTGHTIETWYNGHNTDAVQYNDKSPNGWIETKGKQQKGEVCEYHGVENCSRCNPHHQ